MTTRIGAGTHTLRPLLGLVALCAMSSAAIAYGADGDSPPQPQYPWTLINGCDQPVTVAYAVDGIVHGWFTLAPGWQIGDHAYGPTIGIAVDLSQGGVWRPGPTTREYHVPIGQEFHFYAEWDGGNAGAFPDAIWVPFYEYDTRLFHPFVLCQTYPAP